MTIADHTGERYSEYGVKIAKILRRVRPRLEPVELQTVNHYERTRERRGGYAKVLFARIGFSQHWHISRLVQRARAAVVPCPEETPHDA